MPSSTEPKVYKRDGSCRIEDQQFLHQSTTGSCPLMKRQEFQPSSDHSPVTSGRQQGVGPGRPMQVSGLVSRYREIRLLREQDGLIAIENLECYYLHIRVIGRRRWLLYNRQVKIRS
ncbi:hypothetical protein Bbelb_074040 [Branchiostoma belcheri]|nr:hypothetical protein Bbelb_074040 [Branchiostoma belcheri]